MFPPTYINNESVQSKINQSLTYGQLSDFHVSLRKTSVRLDCSWLIPAGSFKNIYISTAVQTVYEQRMCMFATGAVEL